MKWLLGIAAIGLVALGVTLTAEAPWTLVTGWGPFLLRVLPRVTVEPRTVAFGVTAFVVFAAGIHWLSRSAYKPADGRRWRLRWSLIGVATVVVLFAAGICLIGVVHQTGWLLTADESAVVQVERSKWKSNDSASNLRMMTIGLHNALDAYQGRLLPTIAADGTVLHGWALWSLYGYTSTGDIDRSVAWSDPKNQKYFRSVIPIFLNPKLATAPARDANGYGLSHYAANCRAMANGNFRPLNEFTDGTANTLFIGEANANFEPWGKPGNCRDPVRGINRSPYGFGGPLGSGGALFAMADGSVRFIGERISPKVLNALSTPDGGESVDESP